MPREVHLDKGVNVEQEPQREHKGDPNHIGDIRSKPRPSPRKLPTERHDQETTVQRVNNTAHYTHATSNYSVLTTPLTIHMRSRIM